MFNYHQISAAFLTSHHTMFIFMYKVVIISNTTNRSIEGVLIKIIFNYYDSCLIFFKDALEKSMKIKFIKVKPDAYFACNADVEKKKHCHRILPRIIFLCTALRQMQDITAEYMNIWDSNILFLSKDFMSRSLNLYDKNVT